MARRLSPAELTWDPARSPNLQNFWNAWASKQPGGAPQQPPLIPNLGFKPFSPWDPQPPSGSYDPALDAALEAGQRGLGDLTTDLDTAGTRDRTDYQSGKDQINRGADRSLYDLDTSVERGTADYNRNVAMLQRAFAIKGQQQKQSINAAGTTAGSALMEAARKRQANETIQRQPMDEGFKRFTADTGEQRKRIGEDRDYNLGQLAINLAPPGSEEGGQYGGRRWQDRTTQFTRAGREQTQFEINTGKQRSFQASGAGWNPGVRPRGEYLDAQGKPYRVKVVGDWKYRYGPDGKVITRVRRRPRG